MIRKENERKAWEEKKRVAEENSRKAAEKARSEQEQRARQRLHDEEMRRHQEEVKKSRRPFHLYEAIKPGMVFTEEQLANFTEDQRAMIAENDRRIEASNKYLAEVKRLRTIQEGLAVEQRMTDEPEAKGKNANTGSRHQNMRAETTIPEPQRFTPNAASARHAGAEDGNNRRWGIVFDRDEDNEDNKDWNVPPTVEQDIPKPTPAANPPPVPNPIPSAEMPWPEPRPSTRREPDYYRRATPSVNSSSSTRGRRPFTRSPAPSPPRVPKSYAAQRQSDHEPSKVAALEKELEEEKRKPNSWKDNYAGLRKSRSMVQSPAASETPVAQPSGWFSGLRNLTRRQSKVPAQFSSLCGNCGGNIDHEALGEECPEDGL